MNKPYEATLYLRCEIPNAERPETCTSLYLGNGGAYRDRTDDPLLAKQMLSQLS